ncbi:hypothetical protein Tco_0763980 [Tanacetum coccineum]
MLLQNCNMKKDSDIKLKDVNKRSEVDNDMSNDFWENFNPHEEWKMWETEKTNLSNDRHVVTKKRKIDEILEDVARKLYEEFDGIAKTNGRLAMA